MFRHRCLGQIVRDLNEICGIDEEEGRSSLSEKQRLRWEEPKGEVGNINRVEEIY